MRKRIVVPAQHSASQADQDWLNLEELAEVEITSEDAAHPIEAALLPGSRSGWRAAAPGPQWIRFLFTTPQHLRRIGLRFEEPRTPRTQEYVLRWSGDGGQSYHEIVRQQWNFSPEGATVEIEEYQVDLPAVNVLELNIIPDTSGALAVASLAQLQLA